MLKSDFAVGKRLWLTKGLSLVIVIAVMFPQAVLAQIKLDITEDIQAPANASQVQTLVSKASVPQGTLPHTVLEMQSADSTANHSLPPLEGSTLAAQGTDSTEDAGAIAPAAAAEPVATATINAPVSTTTTSLADTSTTAGRTNAGRANSSQTEETTLSGSLIDINNTSSTSDNTNDSASTDSTILADAEVTPRDARTEAYADSMIKPNRPNDLLYSTGKAEAATQAAPDAISATAANNSLVAQTPSAVADIKPKSIVLFFSAPEQVERTDVDSLTGASVIEKENQRYGITEYVARYIGKQLDAQVYELNATIAYPQDHSALIARSAADFNKIKRQDFSLETRLEPAVELSQVDTIYLGFPLWWNDLPLPVYAFLESTDLSGKTLVPFCTMGGNIPYQLFKQLNKIEPNAKILRGFEINKHKLVKKQMHKRLDRWLEEQGNAANSSTKPSNSKSPS